MHKQLIDNRYRIKALIGEGGMASVYAALDEKLNRQVAIKILHQHLGRNADLRERFLLEARVLSTFDHPNIIKVFDFSGLDSEQLWMVTEILHGVDLAEYVKRLPKLRLHPVVASLIVREVCRALQEVHKVKIVHRDIKPENIMLLDNGHIRLMDFGIAKINRENATQTGTFMGSPSYMSPEQIRGTNVDIRADIYSLSVLFYEILTGTLPFLGATTAEVINKIMVGSYTAPYILLSNIPAKVHSVIVKGMHGQPSQRFQNMAEMIDGIDEYLSEVGFGDSRIELERYMLQRLQFDQRLAASDISNKTIPYSALAEVLDKPTLHLTQVSAQNYEKGAELFHSLATQGSGREFEDANDTDKVLVQQPLAPATLAALSPAAPPPPSKSKVESPKAPISQQRIRSSTRKIFIREHRADSITGQKSSSGSTFVVIGLIAAIALIVIFGGDRISNRFRRDSIKAVQQLETVSKKKKTVPGRSNEDDGAAGPSEPTIVVEAQSVILDSNSKNPPLVGKREISTPRSNRPLSSSTKVLPSPPRRESLAVIKRPSVPAASSDSLRVSDRQPPVTDNIPVEAPSERGTLKVATLPASEVYVDGRMYGVSNDKEFIQNGLKLDAGSYVVKFKRKGYKVEEYGVQIRPGEVKQLNVSLNKIVELVELTVRANKLPARVTIEDMRDGGRRREFTLSKTLVLNLRPGNYKVAVNYGQDTISRVIELGDDEKSLTFNADFK